MEFLIKICGITSLEDARFAAECGATALGFNFYPGSPRHLSVERAGEIIGALPPEVLTVGVFVEKVDPAAAEMVEVLQLHGLRQPEQAPQPPRRVWVATSPESAARFPDHRIVIDSSWGTGRVADWDAVKQLRRSYILSGGLTPENVGEALRKLNPAGVDVCSGVEQSPGIKDPEKVRSFLKAVTWWQATR